MYRIHRLVGRIRVLGSDVDENSACDGAAVTDDEVGVADARRDDANEDLARSRIIELERLERQRGVRCAGDGCANLIQSPFLIGTGHAGRQPER
jgi:hypothetical protein